MRAIRFLAVLALLSNSLSAQFGRQVQYFPQFAVGAGAESHFTVHNPGSEPITVQVELRRSDGSLFREETQLVSAGATVTISFSEGSETISGWAELSSEGDFTATLFYRISGVGNVGVLPSDKARRFKAFNAAENGTRTGFAVANPEDDASAEISFTILDGDGQLLGGGLLGTLGPGEQMALFFDEAPIAAPASGTVELSSTNPVVAVSLRLDPVIGGFLLAGVPVIVPGLPIRAELNEVSPNIIGGHPANAVVPAIQLDPVDGTPGEPFDVAGATIAGGGTRSRVTDNEGNNFVGACRGQNVNCANRVLDSFGTVSGGAGNDSGYFATVGGGYDNIASDHASTVAGGRTNQATGLLSTVGGGGDNKASGDLSTVSGGVVNNATGIDSTIGGGNRNVAGSSATVAGGNRNEAIGGSSTVGGGADNLADGGFGTVAGGLLNIAGERASIGGGSGNRALGFGATVPGGRLNMASGGYSFAAGREAQALHNNSFVWNDSDAPKATTASRQFIIGAAGGVGINVAPSTALDVMGSRIRLRALPLPDRGKEILLRTDGGAVDLTAVNADLFVSSVDGDTIIQPFGGGVGIGTSNPQGKLDVNGSIFQRGSSLHADYVFEEDYELESIEEHSEFMWRERHLPAVSEARKDREGLEIVEYGARVRGILEELEKAHIYIEQLNQRLKEQQNELAEIRATIGERE